MINRFCTSALWECNKTLIAVAQGNLPADLVVRHARLISTPTREVVDDVDIAIACGRIAYVGLDGNTAEHCVGTGTQVIDARGRYAAPGFIDSHIHLESSMLTPSEFARSVLPHGTSAVMWDPHEIANVAGLAAVREMARDAQRTPLKTFITTPSCPDTSRGAKPRGMGFGSFFLVTNRQAPGQMRPMPSRSVTYTANAWPVCPAAIACRRAARHQRPLRRR